jgi:dsDNA-specific endonuclease/ATPase MutS2
MSKEYVRRFILDVRRVIEKGKPPKREAQLPELPPAKMEEAEKAVETAKEMEKLPALDETVAAKAEEKVERAEKKLEKAKKTCKK